jgi:adenylyltransferase/sulfurtransferase
MEIDPEEYLLKVDKYTLIDIREEFEYEIENAGGLNIPYHKLLASPGLLRPDNHYILLCEQGKRSKILADNLREKAGLLNIKSLRGGLRALNNER